ncbi:hypothetical protein SETIT_1G021600v2 [Setaria italica]|uniref:F-box domain-containing protein n=1 Tax=Setaria italica TaxID=4555 RepID=A0A368PFZ1_SETIT|nr:hypothetical protein SETIT_1G021600v2 [Setaria italica]
MEEIVKHRPPELMEEIVEEVLLRFPSEDPASLVRAALVSKRWCRLVSGRGFRRRFREFHRAPPLLGLLCNRADDARCIPTAAACGPPTRATAASCSTTRPGVAATPGRISSPYGIPSPASSGSFPWCPWPCGPGTRPCSAPPATAVTISTATAILSSSSSWGPSTTGRSLASTHPRPTRGAAPTSRASAPMAPLRLGTLVCSSAARSTSNVTRKEESSTMIWRQQKCPRFAYQKALARVLCSWLQRMAGLDLPSCDRARLYLSSREHGPDDGDAGWERSRVIELGALLPYGAILPQVAGFAETGGGVIFIWTGAGFFSIDLKSGRSKEVGESCGFDRSVVPYMSFSTPALKAVSTDE